MSHTLLIRLQGPMQAWGVESLFSERDTLREPSRSGVTGLLCAALGRCRDEPLDDLNSMRMGVRVDREGQLMTDFQTAQRVVNAAGKVLPNPVISNRYYLADAVFLVGLESSDLAFLQSLQSALQRPRWLLFLGRKAFPPSPPVWLPDGLRKDTELDNALHSYPWLVPPAKKYSPQKLRLMIEDPAGGALVRKDHPVSFSDRYFSQRPLSVSYCSAPEHLQCQASDSQENTNVSF